MAQEDIMKVAKSDVIAAWAVLENLAVSLDHIGSLFGEEKNAANSMASQHAMLKALATYLTPPLVKAINDARVRLGHYIPDAEAEALSEGIPYWDSTASPKGPREAA